MVIVDTHCHVSLSWYEPVESLLHQMERHGVSHAVLIQMQGQFNNDYQFACAARFPGRFAPVVIVDTNASDAVQQLERLAARGASGVRFSATTRSPGTDPLAIWRAADQLGLPVSCAGSAAEFAVDEFAQLVEALPKLPIVLEHLAAVSRPATTEAEQAARVKAFGLARYPNVYIKVTGLGEFCRRALPAVEPFPFVQPIPLYLDRVYDAFGPARLMWGSDYPPVSAREGYGNALRLTMEQFAARSATDRDLIFGGTALSVFTPRG